MTSKQARQLTAELSTNADRFSRFATGLNAAAIKRAQAVG